jgi:hypothetical protein
MKTKELAMRETVGKESDYTTISMYLAFKEVFERAYSEGYRAGYSECVMDQAEL